MKKALFLLMLSAVSLPLFSQLLNWSPSFPLESSTSLEIVIDGSKGNEALISYSQSDVYIHTGVITNLSTSNSDWRYVRPGNFNLPEPTLAATYIPGSFPHKWKFTITGGVRTFYGVINPSETILKIALVVRNGAGTRVHRNRDGSDLYIPISDGTLKVKITDPQVQPTFIPVPEPILKKAGDNINISAIASSVAINTTMKIFYNGIVIQNSPASSTISATAVVTTGQQEIVAEAFDGATTKRDTIKFVPQNIQALPASVKDGINYHADNSTATLVLFAPGKSTVSVIGDIPGSNWNAQPQYQMIKTPDANYWWIKLTGLTPGTEYSFQYLVDGILKIADPYAEKILDPWNDQYITTATYPGLKLYPLGLTTGIISELQTAAPAYNWQTTSFARPDKRNLMVYELLLRDYLAAHDWKRLTDTLNYIKKLGINTIELLPFNEFEGNLSWGYNPDFYFAPDKYYGPKNELKAFIDSAHRRGIAVVMDIALNHSFGLSPMVQLYFDAGNNRPSANNPWFNPVAKHAYNVGYDMNHESLATRYFTSRVVTHWLTEYKIDGFRFDLSKGFTQNQTCDGNGGNCNEGAMTSYDASRIAIWKRYYDTLQLKSPGSYAILEHFAANSEERELSDYGMLLWGNLNYSFSEAAMGWIGTSNFDGALHVSRGWSQPHLMSYMESHDEERLMVRNILYGNASGAYSTKDFKTALERMEMNAAFLLTMPGPKMIWQFGELGYDYSINYCPNGTIDNGCRTDNKPIRWDYLQVPGRKDLHDVYQALLQLRSIPLYAEAFTRGTITRNLAPAFKWMTLNSSAGKLVVIGNFDVVTQTGSVTFPAAGTWYDYLGTGTTLTATGAAQSFTLQPGEYHVYLSSNVAGPVKIVKITGTNSSLGNRLIWEVEIGVNLSHYILERSTDGQTFNDITTIPATGARSYNYLDAFLNQPGVYYYRLKQVDIDVSYHYSNILRLEALADRMSIIATPNPFKGSLRITVSSPISEQVTFFITDLSGRRLFEQRIILQKGIQVLQVPQVAGLAAGMYQVRIQSKQQQANTNIIKTK